jgi:hypothetical protein
MIASKQQGIVLVTEVVYRVLNAIKKPWKERKQRQCNEFTESVRAIDLMMKAASTSGTSVNFYQTTRRNNPEDSHLHVFILFSLMQCQKMCVLNMSAF